MTTSQRVGIHAAFVVLASGVCSVADSSASAGEPYIPADNGQVLETLPRAVLAGRDEITRLRQQLSSDPDNAELAADVAQRYEQLGKRGGGPRYFGYARAAISPWWQAELPPTEVLRVRAKLKENNHDYRGALADIEALIAQSPEDPQAWVERVNLLRVQGQYDRAWQATEEFTEFAEGTAGVFSRAPLLAVTGNAAEAAARLDQAIPVTRDNLPDALPWMLTLRAEIARAMGNHKLAESHYQAAIEADPNYGAALRAYADFLLDRDQADRVLALIADDQGNDLLNDNGLLLAATLAAAQTDDPRAQEFQQELRDRFRETRLRGDLPHGRYESRFALQLESDSQRALKLALDNWDNQKEARDSRNVLEAALAAGRAEAAAPVVEFLEEAGTEDVDLQQFIDEVKSK